MPSSSRLYASKCLRLESAQGAEQRAGLGAGSTGSTSCPLYKHSRSPSRNNNQNSLNSSCLSHRLGIGYWSCGCRMDAEPSFENKLHSWIVITKLALSLLRNRNICPGHTHQFVAGYKQPLSVSLSLQHPRCYNRGLVEGFYPSIPSGYSFHN